MAMFRNMQEKSNNRPKWVDLHYVDLVGKLHSLTISYSRYEEGSIEFYMDGSSVKLAEISDSDLGLIPDRDTFRLLPWDTRRGRVFCYIGRDGEIFWGDSRFTASKLRNYLLEQGLTEKVGVEMEFFIHKVRFVVAPKKQEILIDSGDDPPNGVLMPKTGYESCEPFDTVREVRNTIVETLGIMGIEVVSHHHEVASGGQVELASPTGSSREVGDYIETIKYVSRKVSNDYGLIANFMAKPIFGDNGSGMHIHMSLWLNGMNTFYDKDDKYGISQKARYFIGGLIEHGRSLAAIVSPTTNSYKRLVPGYEAPTYLVWGIANRSVAIRIPRTNSHTTKRIEFRPPDPTANPYLALTAVIMAGMDGISRKIDPGDPVTENVYKMPEYRMRELGIKHLPKSLSEALDELESDYEYLRPVFSKELIMKYIDIKREEVRKIESYPSPAEFATYLTY
jgi:glutamine synthetase